MRFDALTPTRSVTQAVSLPSAVNALKFLGAMPDIVCYCFRVEKPALITAIQAGCHTADALSQATGACRGCGGCRWDLEALIEFYSKQPQVPPVVAKK